MTVDSLYKGKMKFDKIWGYQNEEVPFKQDRQNLNFNHLRYTDDSRFNCNPKKN